jgi:hypothetical protein
MARWSIALDQETTQRERWHRLTHPGRVGRCARRAGARNVTDSAFCRATSGNPRQRRNKMKRVVVACAAFALTAGAALAASPNIEAAIKTFKATATDTGKLKIFCEMQKAMDDAGEKESAATDAKIDGYMKQLGSEFQTAWNTGDNLDENSADAKALYTAIDELSAKCK